MRLKIDRAWKKAAYTIGRFFVNGIRLGESLEDPDRGLNSSMDEATIKAVKVYGETAIPTGTYRVVLSVSEKYKKRSWAAKYGGRVPEILGVKGFSGVRIHPGNTAEDSLGCPLVGENKKVGQLVNSQKKYFELMDKLMPAWNSGEDIFITIK